VVLPLDARGVDVQATVLARVFIEVRALEAQLEVFGELIFLLVLGGDRFEAGILARVEIKLESVLQLRLSDRVGITVLDQRVRLDGPARARKQPERNRKPRPNRAGPHPRRLQCPRWLALP